MKNLYALSGFVALCGLAGHLFAALPAFFGLLAADHHPDENVFTSSFAAWGRPGFPFEGLDGISPFVFLISAALWALPLRLLGDAMKGADKPDE